MPPVLMTIALLDAELLAQQRLGRRDRIPSSSSSRIDPPAPPPLDRAAEQAHQVLGLFLDLDVAVAQHAEHAVAVDAEAGKQQVGEAADELLDGDDRSPSSPGTRTKRGSALGISTISISRPPSLEARRGEQHAHPHVGDERERDGSGRSPAA